MKPLKLTMTAFGPYSKTEVVDFRELHDRKLFLITGPTGAGKTSIFDGISYALYGKTSGTDRPERSVRSNNADTDLMTLVAFEFELKGKHYLVERIPEQDKPKVRGEGFTRQASDATLTMEGIEKPITGSKKVSSYLEDLIGLNFNQFRQIMMIPQGEFRELLMADSAERTKIMKSIFRTQFYDLLQRNFADQKNTLRRQLETNLKLRDLEISKIDPCSDGLFQLISAEDKHVEVILEETRSQIQVDLLDLVKVREGLLKVKTQMNELLSEKAKAEELNKQLDTLKTYQEALKVLKADEESKNRLRKQTRTLEQAEKVQGVEAAYRKRMEEAKDLEDKLKGLEETLVTLKADREKAEAQVALYASPQVEKHIEALSAEIMILNKQVEALEKVRAKRDSQNVLAKKIESLEAQGKAMDQSLAETKIALKEALDFIQSHDNLDRDILQEETKIKDLEEDLKLLTSFETYMSAMTDLNQSIEDHKAGLTALEKTYEAALDDYKRHKKSYFLNQAALLAAELEEDMPCPVCGSKDHPNLAQLTDDHVTEDLLQKQEETLNTSHQALTAKTLLMEKDVTRLSEWSERLVNYWHTLIDKGLLGTQPEDLQSGQRLISEKQKDLSATKTKVLHALEQLKSTAKTLSAFKIKAQDLQVRIDKEESDQEVLKKDLTLQEMEHKSLKAEIDTMLMEIPEDQQDAQVLAMKLADKQEDHKATVQKKDQVQKDFKQVNDALIDQSSRLATNQEQLVHIREKLVDERLKYDQALAAADLQEVNYLMLKEDLDKLSSYQEVLKNYDQEVAIKSQQVKDLSQSLEGVAYKDLKDLTLQLETLHAEETSQNERLAGLDRRIQLNQKQVQAVEKLTEKMAKEEEEYKLVADLADVVNGKNLKNITLERYILASYLEEILEVANLRLKVMTNNRYTLKLSDAIMDGRKGSGLDLEVNDSYTGAPRSVRTLSGGESFKASLAMALALAEVVQAHAGGIQLDTVFIDEGFGTLDQESLDNAINCLIELQDAGRLVGIISHVRELKERIPTQLRVIPSETGSTTMFQIG